MPLTDKQADWIAGGIAAALLGYIGYTAYNTYSVTQALAPNLTPGQLTTSNCNKMSVTTGQNPTCDNGINNPGNIEVSSIPWQGKITPAGAGPMEQFATMWQGYRALIDTIKSHYKTWGQTTLNLFMAGNGNPGYAPASVPGNNPSNEASFAASKAGISADDDIGQYLNNPTVLGNIVAGIAVFEQGETFIPNQADIQMAMNDLGIMA